jgi:hypothetical protein
MSDNLKKCLNELKLAMQYKHKPTRNAILKFLSNKKCIYNALREISMNILNKQIKLKNHHIRKLNPHVKTIKALGKGVKHRRTQQKLVLQSGGFLPWLLPLVASAIPAVIDLIK